MEDSQYEKMNFFNNNFKCNDFRNILKLYKKHISLVEYFKNIKLKEERYQHPLFKNYNYCLICNQKQKTKYNSIDLVNSHIELKEKTIGHYLLNNNIKLREIINKKEKLAKRRFINSYDNINKNNENIENDLDLIIENESNTSDTELYISNNKNIINENLISKSSQKSRIYPIKLTKIEKNKMLKKSRNFADNHSYNKKNKKKDYNKYNNGKDNNIYILPIGQNNLITQSTERRMNIEDENQINLDSLSSNLEKDDIKLDFNNIGKKFIKYKSDDKDKTTIINNIKNSPFNIEEDKASNKTNKLMNIIEETRNILGWGRRKPLLEFYKHRTLSNNIFEQNNNIRNKKKSKYFSEKNDNCNICLQEIKEKFTLTCGDFFCRECIRNMIIEGIQKISNLDTLDCPTCNELLEENIIKKLLSVDEFQKYQKLITKIQGLKNKDHIPCPYPDCPGWAEDNHNDINIVTCQYDHNFCKKCQKIIDKEEVRNNSKHKCYKNMTEDELKTMEFFKQNKFFRKCPNCQSMVVREEVGCNKMTCTNIWCGYEFCWICNKKYEESHYKNPLSMCFGLSEMDYNERLAKFSRDRLFRCILIFLLIIFVLLPIVIMFFSIFAVILYIITFVLDGSYMKHIKLKSDFSHRFFYKIVYLFFIFIGFAYIPIGYMSLAVLIAIAIPGICIFHKIRQINEEELE